MIKVIASDLDGTLLGDDHQLGEEEYLALKEAQAAGIRVIIATGRDFQGTMAALEGYELECDYIVASGAEVRDSEGRLLKCTPMETKLFPEIMEVIERKYSGSCYVRFCGNGKYFFIGDEETVHRQIAAEGRLFLGDDETDDDTLVEMWNKIVTSDVTVAGSLDELMKYDDPIYKIFISSGDSRAISDLKADLDHITTIAIASSFPENLELTDIRAQKGPVLAEYIKSLGYTMDEVMVFGDSLNDYSMLSMDFGDTVAVENAMDEVKRTVKHIADSNTDHGVAKYIREFLKTDNADGKDC